jgi:diguanylate cyclase (GGDEF)-like protein
MSIVLSSENSTGPITRSLNARLVVLIVGDSKEDADQITRELESSGYTVAAQRVDTPQTYAAALERGSWDIIISARESKSLSGVAVVQTLREREIDTPVVLLTDTTDEVQSLEAVAAGAEDVLKREDLYRLPYVVGRILQQAQIRHDQAAMLETGRLTLHRRGRGLGLRRLLIVGIVSLVTAVALLGSWYAYSRTEQARRQLVMRVQRSAEAVALMVNSASESVSLRGVAANHSLAAYAMALSRAEQREFAIVDRTRTVLVHSFPFQVGSLFQGDPHGEVRLTIEDGTVREFVTTGAGAPKQMHQLVVPIRSEAGPITGAVIVNYTSERIALDQRLRREVLGVLMLVGLIAGVAIFAYAALFTLRVLAPVERLREAASKLSLGSLDVEVPKGPSNEIGDIAVGLDTLRKRLKKSLLSRQSDMVQRLRAEEALRQVHLRQKHQLEETELRARELTQLAQMGALLHACANQEEACQIVGRFLGELFPELPSMMYLKDGATEAFKPMIAHGIRASAATEITTADCWALRRGQVHAVTADGRELRCAHLDEEGDAGSLCVPLMAQATAIGVLHIRNPRAAGSAGLPKRVPSQALAETVAEQAALSIANLRLREELRELSISDPLTTLYNRRFAQETLNREIHRAHRERGSIGVISFDIDFFKRINDRFGHDAGDAVLKGVAQQLQSSIRGGDIACRMGGEEFAVMMPGATLAIARQRAEEVRNAIAAMRIRHAQLDMPPISMSCGVAAFPDHGVTADALLRAADQALYRAKEAGRDRVESAAA